MSVRRLATGSHGAWAGLPSFKRSRRAIKRRRRRRDHGIVSDVAEPSFLDASTYRQAVRLFALVLILSPPWAAFPDPEQLRTASG